MKATGAADDVVRARDELGIRADKPTRFAVNGYRAW
jgi:hypothetical protein